MQYSKARQSRLKQRKGLVGELNTASPFDYGGETMKFKTGKDR